jgi:hypothetical protein
MKLDIRGQVAMEDLRLDRQGIYTVARVGLAQDHDDGRPSYQCRTPVTFQMQLA